MPKGIKGFQKGNKVGVMFTKDYQPEGKGRKPSLITIARQAENWSKNDVAKAIQFVSGKTREELVNLAKDPETPIAIAIIAKELASGNFKALMELFKFTYGSTIEFTGAMQLSENVKSMTDEELQRELQRFEKITNGSAD